MKWTRREITAEANDLDRAAARTLDGARDADRTAADPTTPAHARDVATAAGRTLRQQARDMRAVAAALREGVDPTELGYTTDR